MNTPHSADALKPCPFCGGQPKIHAKELDERYAYANEVKVQCSSCGVSVTAVGDTSKPGYADNSTTEKRAIAAWNRRPTPASGLCADLNAERINPTPASPGLDNEAAARLRKQAEEAKKMRGVVALSPEDAFALLDCLERAEADVAALRKEHDSYQRMFAAACEDLGAINEALNLDPDDGGAEPILEAIKELRERAEAAAGAVPEVVTFRADRVIASLDFALTGIHGKDAVRLILTHRHGSHDIAMHREAASFIKDALDRAAAPPAQGLPAAQTPWLETDEGKAAIAAAEAEAEAYAAEPSDGEIYQMMSERHASPELRAAVADEMTEIAAAVSAEVAAAQACPECDGAGGWGHGENADSCGGCKGSGVTTPPAAAPSITSLIEQHGSILSAANEQSRLAAAPSEPVLWFKRLDGANALPDGRCYSVVFTPLPDHQPLFATPPAQDAGTGEAVKYGCHCDLEPHMEPDGCVIDTGRTEDCVYAKRHASKEACEYWQPVKFRAIANSGRTE